MTLFVHTSAISNAGYARTWAQLADQGRRATTRMTAHTIATRIACGCLVLLSSLGAHATTLSGRIVSAADHTPIADAIVIAGNTEARTDADGHYRLEADAGVSRVNARAIGFGRASAEITADAPLPLIALPPIRPKGLYLSVYGIGSQLLRNRALALLDSTELNALVIDVKGDRGLIPYPSTIPLARQIGASKVTTVRDMPALIESLKARDVYLIARIVVFKDDLLAAARPDLAVRSAGGGTYVDREQLRWVDPARREAWDYNLQIAEEAAALGFDEIQFDYVRFPDQRGIRFSLANTEANRVNNISGFLAAARERLRPYNVFVAADVFGYIAWNANDSDIGQTLAGTLAHVDYLSPMLYPSGFQFGIPGYRTPVANSYHIVNRTLQRAAERTGISPLRLRPWLQAFRDYAFDHRTFGPPEIRAQIKASADFGSDGWMLWNPRNCYSDAGLGPP